MKRALPCLAVALACLANAGEILTVESVVKDGAAETAGVRAGDRLMRLGGTEIDGLDVLQRILAGKKGGERVPLLVLRGEETVELELELGTHPTRGASLGVRLTLEEVPEPGETPPDELCLGWIEETYRLEALTRELGLDLAADRATTQACVADDAFRLPRGKVLAWCDNVFKIHCSGVDLLAEVGDALVARCEKQLEASQERSLDQDRSWLTCARHRVFDRYARDGEVSDEATCLADLEACAEATDTTSRR